jgi:hypothetical protein
MRSGPSWKKKQKNCDPENPEDETKGDQWDLTGIDVESRLLVSVVIGKRSKENVKKVVADFADRTNNIPPALITTDDCSTYAEALLEQYGETVVPEKTGAPGRPRDPFKQWPEKAVYATVNKTYSKGAVKAVSRKLVHGTEEDLVRALESSSCSNKINTAFVERQNGTDRSYNARKARKTYEYSKDLFVHMAVTWWVVLCYNFHHVHAGLRQRCADGTYLHRTPAMSIGLESQPLTVRELFSTQVVGFSPVSIPNPADWGSQRAQGHVP